MSKLLSVFRSKNFLIKYTCFMTASFTLMVILSNIFGWAGQDLNDGNFFAHLLAYALIVPGLIFPFVFVIWLLEKIRHHQMSSTQKSIFLGIAGAVLVLSGLFYWFQYRPTEIRTECAQNLRTAASNPNTTISSIKEAEYVYELCLHSKGL